MADSTGTPNEDHQSRLCAVCCKVKETGFEKHESYTGLRADGFTLDADEAAAAAAANSLNL